MNWEEQVCMVYFLSDKDRREEWTRMFSDELVSASAEQVLLVWQHLVQMQDNQMVVVLFQYVTSHKVVKNKVLLFTLENDDLLVCNGYGSANLVSVTHEDLIDMLDWWSNLPTMDIPAQAHPVYTKVFACDSNVKSIHLFSETHDITSNVNLRLAQFNMICDAASRYTPSFPPQ